jgi:nicotinamidase-related amidase
MPLTAIDPVAALVVVDLQKGMAGIPTAHPLGDIVGRASRLAHAFRARGLPVVLVNVVGVAPGRTDAARPQFALPPDWTELVPELASQAGDYLVTKQRWGAFISTQLNEQLRQRGVTQVFVAGVATSIGVESTARSAYDHGYHVVLLADAMTDLDADTHRHSIEKILPKLGEVATTDEVLACLESQPRIGPTVTR